MPQILILEDDAALNNGIVLSLKNDSYQITQAFNITEARKYLNSTVFNLNQPSRWQWSRVV